MKHALFNLSITILFFVVLIPQVLAVGKPETNPGQEKKINNTQNKKLTIGSVEQVDKSTVLIEDKKTQKKLEALVDTNTLIVDKNNKAIKLGALKLKDKLAIISTDSGLATDGAKIGNIKKIYVKLASESASKRNAIHGVIQSVTSDTITLTHQIQTDRVFTIKYDAATQIKIKGVTDASASTLLVGQRIVAVGTNVNGTIQAAWIHVIPGKATGIFKKNPSTTPSGTASPSASTIPSRTPSASINPSPSTSPAASLVPSPTT